MAFPVLIPADQSAVQPCVTPAEAVEDLLDAAGIKRDNLALASMTHEVGPFQERKRDGTVVEVANKVWIVASSRRIHSPESIKTAGRVLTDALYSGKLRAYVRDPEDKEYYRVVRDYWQDVEVTDDGFQKVVVPFSCEKGDWRESVIGQPIMLSKSGFDRWTREGLIRFGSAASAKPVSISALRNWIIACIRAGDSMEAVVTARLGAFPENMPPSREPVRDLYREIATELGLEIRRGRPYAA